MVLIDPKRRARMARKRAAGRGKGWQPAPREVRDLYMKLGSDAYPQGFFTDGDIAAYQGLYRSLPEKAVTVELGVWFGRSLCVAGEIAKTKGIRIYGVDTWDVPPEGVRDPEYLTAFAQTLASIRQFGLLGTVAMLPMTSDMAARWFDDGELDLVFIDADHSYEAVKRDIQTWVKKLKVGGILCGHDYWPGSWPEVRRAVNECCPKIRTFPGSGVWVRR